MKPKQRPFVSLKGSETGKKTKTGRILYKYKNQPISEKVVDIEMEGRIYLIPTVVGDKLYKDPEIPIRMFMNRELKAVHSFPKGNLPSVGQSKPTAIINAPRINRSFCIWDLHYRLFFPR